MSARDADPAAVPAAAQEHTPHRCGGVLCLFQVTQTRGRVPLLVRARFFDGLADPARLALLDAVRDGEMTAGEAAMAAGLAASNASNTWPVYGIVGWSSPARSGDTCTTCYGPASASSSWYTIFSSSG
jgi:hypothetical protein